MSGLNVVVEPHALPSFLAFLPGEEGTYHRNVSLSLRRGRTRERDLQNAQKSTYGVSPSNAFHAILKGVQDAQVAIVAFKRDGSVVYSGLHRTSWLMVVGAVVELTIVEVGNELDKEVAQVRRVQIYNAELAHTGRIHNVSPHGQWVQGSKRGGVAAFLRVRADRARFELQLRRNGIYQTGFART